jgi:hypothetical protein
VTQAEILTAAATKAQELNLPWYAGNVRVARPPLGRITGVLEVTSVNPVDNVTLVLRVREATGEVWPVRARYAASTFQPNWAFFVRRVAWGVVFGVVGFFVLRSWAEAALIVAVLLAIAIALVAAVFSVRFEEVQ